MTRVLLAVALLALLCGNAGAQQPALCGEHDAIVAQLLSKYGESVVGRGISFQGLMMEVFASEAGSWSVLLSSPAGSACIVSAGENWETQEPPLPGKGA